MGIFRTRPVVGRTGRVLPLIFLLAWLVGGVIAAFAAGLTYAEIGSRIIRSRAAITRYFSYGYHPSLAFAVNCIILVSNAGSIAAVAVIGAEYISPVFYDNPSNHPRAVQTSW